MPHLSFDEARKTTRYSQQLLSQYCSKDHAASGMAAFRIDAFLTEPTNQPVAASILKSIADALRIRMANRGSPLEKSDLRIGLSLHTFHFFNREDMESLVMAMKGTKDFAVVSEASRLLPIIGSDFIQSYLKSAQLSETGGMGGPQKPLIREMAEEVHRNFIRSKTN